MKPKPSAIDPQHYKALSPEPIDVIESWALSFHLANALKYIARAGRKDGNSEAQDLRKAVRYLSRRVNQLEGRSGWTLDEPNSLSTKQLATKKATR